MNVLAVLAISSAFFWVAARFYGRQTATWLGEEPDRPTPAVIFQDGRDYVPTSPHVIFAHHFSAIAGAGPIIGPTLAAIYGYAPVWLWLLLGGVFIGAVHDFSALFVSLRERGRSMAEIARSTLGNVGFGLFIAFAVVMIVLVTAAFLRMTAVSLTSECPLAQLGLAEDQNFLRTAFKTDPNTGRQVLYGRIGGIAATSVAIITLFSPFLGWLLYRRRFTALWGYAAAALVGICSILIGVVMPLHLSLEAWLGIIAVYVLIAAGVPVWLILQPRDFINVQVLYLGIVAMFAGLCLGGIQGMAINLPAFDFSLGASRGPGALWPMLFITVACGAVSGFHSLVATGTTSKQLSREAHGRWLGYNAMLLESLLGVCALLVIAGALPRSDYFRYVWPDDPRQANPILAFSLSLGLLWQKTFGLPVAAGAIFGILLLEGFVITSLDVAIRLNRYLLEELWQIVFRGRPPAFLLWPWFNSCLAVGLMLLFAWKNAFKLLWPLFATGNQLLAALGMLAVSCWLLVRRRQAWFTLLPAAFLLLTTFASLIIQLEIFARDLSAAIARGNGQTGPALLLITDVLLLALAVAVVILAGKVGAKIFASRPGAGLS
ncbi:MAG: carbon starvation protein A [Planctomycetota bacterium]|nr:carbon starvation protein A [Planctomycetota bacterium]